MELHNIIHTTPVHLEQQRLSEYVSKTELLQIACEVLKLPVEQLLSFHTLFCSLGEGPLKRLIALLSLDSSQLLELRTALSMEDSNNAPNSLSNSDKLVPLPREDLFMTTGFSPPASLPTHKAGPMKTSVGSLELGAVPMDLGFADDFEFANMLDREDSGTFDPFSNLNSEFDDMVVRTDDMSSSTGLAEFNDNYSSNNNNNSNSNSNNDNSHNNNNNNADFFGEEESGGGMSRYDRGMEAISPPLLNVPKQEDNGADDLMPPDAFQNPSENIEGSSHFALRIVVQPVAKTVYQRIIRPFPAVLLEGAAPGVNFFVEVTLCTNDSEEPLSCLTGATRMRISNGLFATFKRLKVTSTSQQIGSLFRLRFQLKSFNGSTFSDVAGVVALSQPVEVFSHTHYLTNKKKSQRPALPTVTDVIPSAVAAAGGTKVVILGSDFVKCPQLKVKIGTVEVPANFHEPGTLWIYVPPLAPNKSYKLEVSNDGLFWGVSPVQLHYM